MVGAHGFPSIRYLRPFLSGTVAAMKLKLIPNTVYRNMRRASKSMKNSIESKVDIISFYYPKIID